jgi:two-component system LytT family response regulator
MRKIRVLIVDDEPLAREGMRIHLREETGIEIIGECANGVDAVSAIARQSPDLVFLDVKMPLLDGFGVAEAVGLERMPVVIFVTAFDEYALRAFEAHALDYLLKPVDGERLRESLKRARAQLENKSSADYSRQLLAMLDDFKAGKERSALERKYLERVAIKSAGRVFFLEVERIGWITAEGNYVRLHAGRESYLLRETIAGIESKLSPDQFLRIRRSTLVRINFIRELHPLFNGQYELLLEGGTRLTSSRRYRKNLDALLKA